MKRNEVNGIINFLDRVPVSKIKSKPLRSRLTIAVFTLQKESRQINADINSLRDETISGHEDRMKLFSEVAQNYNMAKTVAEREALLSRLNREFSEEQKLNETVNEAINDFLEGESSVKIQPFEMDEFMDAMASVGIEVTGREIRAIEPILKVTAAKEQKEKK